MLLIPISLRTSMRSSLPALWIVLAALGCPLAAAGEPPPAEKPAGLLDILAALSKSVRPVEETMAAALQRGDVKAAE
jgi:hypothetical protein